MPDNLDIYDKKILQILVSNKDRFLSVCDIADMAQINWKTATKHIDKLIAQGLIEEEHGKKGKSTDTLQEG